MSTYAGVDYSTRKVALAVMADGLEMLVLSYNAPKKLTGIDATKDVLSTFSDWCTEGYLLDSQVFIESPIMGRMLNAQTAVGMGIAAGALMQASLFYGAGNVDFIAPSFWKKAVAGNGGLDKVGVADWMEASRPDLLQCCKNDDEVDAVCLALLAKQLAETEA